MVHGAKETQRHDERRVHFLSDSGPRSVASTRHSCLSVLKKKKTASCDVSSQLSQGSPDGIGHQNDGLQGHKPAKAAERQLEAVPDEPEEQHVDVLQVIPHPHDLAAACSNSHHFENSKQTRPEPKRRPTNACSNFLHTLTHSVACNGHGSVKERNATKHWPTRTSFEHF